MHMETKWRTRSCFSLHTHRQGVGLKLARKRKHGDNPLNVQKNRKYFVGAQSSKNFREVDNRKAPVSMGGFTSRRRQGFKCQEVCAGCSWKEPRQCNVFLVLSRRTSDLDELKLALTTTVVPMSVRCQNFTNIFSDAHLKKKRGTIHPYLLPRRPEETRCSVCKKKTPTEYQLSAIARKSGEPRVSFTESRNAHSLCATVTTGRTSHLHE